MPRRKLQVFVSSTFTDLQKQRQAAVEAILLAGHLPAGMELFGADDKKQMEVIRGWIADSDVFLILLAGRYGSVDKDSGKSYTHLEYEHAVALKKPVLAMVMTDDAIEALGKEDLSFIERDNGSLLRTFRGTVMDGRLVSFFRGVDDLKLNIIVGLGNIDRREDLVGWVRGSEAGNFTELANQLAASTKEATALRARVAELEKDAVQAATKVPESALRPMTITASIGAERYRITTTWVDFFLDIGPELALSVSEDEFQIACGQYICRTCDAWPPNDKAPAVLGVAAAALQSFSLFGWVTTAPDEDFADPIRSLMKKRKIFLTELGSKVINYPPSDVSPKPFAVRVTNNRAGDGEDSAAELIRTSKENTGTPGSNE